MVPPFHFLREKSTGKASLLDEKRIFLGVTCSLDLVLRIRGWSEGSKKPECRRGRGSEHTAPWTAPRAGGTLLAASSSWWPEFGQSASKGLGVAMQGPAELLCSRVQSGSEIKGQVCDLSGVFPSLHAHVH